MKKLFNSIVLFLMAVLSANAAITEQAGWFEAAYVKWAAVSGATDYNVYVKKAGGSYTQIDKQLVRKYPNYYRADVVGLAAGNYQMKVVPVVGGAEDAAAAMESGDLTVVAHDRNGFAHYGRSEGIGAYNNDGTLKSNARVLYITANNAKTVSLEMQVDSKGKMETRTGLQNIIQAYEKSCETRPLAVRIIGCIKNANMDEFGSSAEGLQVKGKSSATVANLTIEGIGDDATIHGFGILCRSISSVEFRNFAIMICLDDCLSLDTDNKNVWIHNMDFFYGGTGSASDQAKGDGTVDIKGKSSHVTMSYCHFFDSGKCSLGGMKSETTDCWMTYHHNWFDHSDSRHPRIRTAFYHVYNNYFDGNAKYAIGVTCGGSAYAESNYFRNCKYPFLSSKQGTDAEGDGTFSGESGGVIKVYNNYIRNPRQVLYYDGKQTDGAWDAVKVENRSENVSATAFSGGTSYNNAATTAAIAAVNEAVIDDPQAVPAIVKGNLGAGRMGHGDFKWTFLNSVQDANYGVISELKSALLSYKSTLVGFADGTAISNGGATETVDGGDGKGINPETNDAFVPEWGSGGDGPEEKDFEEEPYIANVDGTDFYWVGDENVAKTEQYIADGIITFADGQGTNSTGVVPPTKFVTTYKGNDTYPSEHVGALQLGQATAAGTYNGGSATFYCPKGVTTFKINALRTGSCYYIVQKSTDGVNFTKVAEVNKASAGILSKDFSSAVRDAESTDPVWIRVVNGSTGGLNIFGVLINQLLSDDTKSPSDLKAITAEKALSIGETYAIAKGTDYTTTSTGAINFSTTKSSVATVSADGTITAVGEGTATITISQAADDNYKGGTASISVTVKDPRAESSFALTSEAAVTMTEGGSSSITTTGAAGAITYNSDKTAVATVDANGKITAVAAGQATITITDAGSATVKGASVTVKVTVTKDMSGSTIVNFTYENKTLAVSDPTLVSLASANVKTGSSATYAGTEYTVGAKMESTTLITLTPPSDAKVTLVFDNGANTKFKVNGTSVAKNADNQYTFDAKAGETYQITKDQTNVFLYLFVFEFGTAGEAGDVDGDGQITMSDANAVVNKYLGTEVEPFNAKQADMDGDGQITMSDANAIVNKYLGVQE